MLYLILNYIMIIQIKKNIIFVLLLTLLLGYGAHSIIKSPIHQSNDRIRFQLKDKVNNKEDADNQKAEAADDQTEDSGDQNKDKKIVFFRKTSDGSIIAVEDCGLFHYHQAILFVQIIFEQLILLLINVLFGHGENIFENFSNAGFIVIMVAIHFLLTFIVPCIFTFTTQNYYDFLLDYYIDCQSCDIVNKIQLTVVNMFGVLAVHYLYKMINKK